MHRTTGFNGSIATNTLQIMAARRVEILLASLAPLFHLTNLLRVPTLAAASFSILIEHVQNLCEQLNSPVDFYFEVFYSPVMARSALLTVVLFEWDFEPHQKSARVVQNLRTS